MKDVQITYRNQSYTIVALTSSAMGSISRFVCQNAMTEAAMYKLAKAHPRFYEIYKNN